MPDNFQLEISKEEEARLLHRVEEDINDAKSAHDARWQRAKRYYEKFRNRLPDNEKGQVKDSNYSVPLTQIHTLAKWARQLEALFGDEAEIRAHPTGPVDHKIVEKVSRYMTARAIRNKKIKKAWTVLLLWEIIWGRAHAYCPWEKQTFMFDGKERVGYEGPMLYPLWPDDFITPAETVTTLHEFSWIARRYRVSPDALLRGEEKDKYRNIKANFSEILNRADDGDERDSIQPEEVKEAVDEAEGVNYEGSSTKYNVTAIEWHGKWRMLKGSKDATELDVDARELKEQDLVVTIIPSMHRVIGVQGLDKLYPKSPEKRPFVELSLIDDGSYWNPGLGELLETMEDASTANYRLMEDAGQFTVGPVTFYDPASGFDAQTFTYRPRTAIPSANPQSVNTIDFTFNPIYFLTAKNALEADAEKVTGQSDPALGRASDRPNAPRTATGQRDILTQGDTRGFIDVDSLKDDAGAVLSKMWQLEQEFPSKSRFFRITEEDAGGLMDVKGGGSTITPEEMKGGYDFTVRFATPAASKVADKELALTLYQLFVQNPLFLTNPKALWILTNKVWKAMGYANLADVIPEPPDSGQPKKPQTEWAMMLQGEDVDPHAQEDEAAHLRVHFEQLRAEKEDERPDAGAIEKLTEHISETQKQRRQKQLTTGIIEALVNSMKGGLNVGGAGPVSLQNLQATIDGMLNPEGGANAGTGIPGSTEGAQGVAGQDVFGV